MPLISIICPHCGLTKDVPDERIPAGSVRITCPKCKQVFMFRKADMSLAKDIPPAAPEMQQPDSGEPKRKETASPTNEPDSENMSEEKKAKAEKEIREIAGLGFFIGGITIVATLLEIAGVNIPGVRLSARYLFDAGLILFLSFMSVRKGGWWVISLCAVMVLDKLVSGIMTKNFKEIALGIVLIWLCRGGVKYAFEYRSKS